MNNISDTLQYEKPVILVGPADFDFSLFKMLCDHGFAIVAADGGANRLYDKKIMPDAIIGDLDSLNTEKKFGSDTKIIHVREQETTDFEKCLQHVDAPIFLAMGFTGRRLDHTLANIHTIAKFHETKNILMVGSDDVSFVHHGIFSSPSATQTTVSIFPLIPIRFAQSQGLLFALDQLKMEVGDFVGTSNCTVKNTYSITPADEFCNTPYLITLSNGNLYDLIKTCLQNFSGNPN